eukprot:CAMPEP_0194538398 /NCGR_PEP_ID=MMETSP0253-20130528/77920_1 /TAXON_ID=2966 /ORGANISM="Noctiluca scintillans" /LENGTH=198 /DNA_ID=CAMNT_0039384515 /DNA_START=3 /DNA_END=596 /DNA_ORIENTATION=+
MNVPLSKSRDEKAGLDGPWVQEVMDRVATAEAAVSPPVPARRKQTCVTFVLLRHTITGVFFLEIPEDDDDPVCCVCCSSAGLSRADRIRLLVVGIMAVLFALTVPGGRFALFLKVGGLLLIDSVLRVILRTPDYRWLNHKAAACCYYGVVSDIFLVGLVVYVVIILRMKRHLVHGPHALELWVLTRFFEVVKLVVKYL